MDVVLLRLGKKHMLRAQLHITSCARASGWCPITAGMPAFMMPALARAMDSKLPPAQQDHWSA